MKLFRTHKKVAVAGLAVTVALLAGGAAFAYFTTTGSGTGSAATGNAQNVSITQIGAGYDSIISSGDYTQDQCFACSGPNELGNAITLSTPDAVQLVNVVVAIHNWGAEVNGVPLTLTISNTVGGGPISDTVSQDFAAAINPNTDPSTTDVTFNFASQGAFVDPSFVYGITFNTTPGAAPVASADSLDVALSSSANNLSIGTDTTPGTIWLLDTYGNNNDFPTCTTGLSDGNFEQVTTNCGSYNPDNPGAYGTAAQVAAGSDDIPAVQVNIVGGTIPALYPNGPSEPVDYAIVNNGSTSAYVQTVTSSVTSVGTQSIAGDEACSTTMYPIANPVKNVDANVPPGTTIFSPSGSTISMTDDGNNQDNCEGQGLTLSFVSN